MANTSKTAREIFEEARKLKDSTQRKAFIDRSCKDNKTLRLKVENLIKNHQTTTGVSNQPGSQHDGTEDAKEVSGKASHQSRPALPAGAALALILIACVGLCSWLAVRASIAVRLERTLRRQADANRIKAEETRDQARENAYAGDMKAADTAINEGNLGHAMDLLRKHIPKPGERDLRGMEWRFLWVSARGDEIRSFEHPGIVTSVSLSKDGKLLATACQDENVRVWNAESGELLTKFREATSGQTLPLASFFPDQKQIVSSSYIGLTMREAGSWKIIRQLASNSQGGCLTPDGRIILNLDLDRISIWDTSSWKLKTLPNGMAAGSGPRVAITPDGKFVAATSQDAQVIEVWEVDAGTKKYELVNQIQPEAVTFSPDGKWLAAGGISGQLMIWSMETGQVVVTNKPHAGWLQGLAFSPDGNVLATGGSDQVIQLWDISGKEPQLKHKLATLKGHQSEIWSLNISSDGRYLASGSKDATAKLWKAKPEPRTIRVLRTEGNNNFVGNVSKDYQATIVTPNGGLEIWDGAENRLVNHVTVPPDVLLQSRIGSELELVRQTNVFFATTNGAVESWNVVEGKRSKSASAGLVSLINVSRDERMFLAYRLVEHASVLYDFDTGKSLANLPDSTIDEAPDGIGRSRRASFSPDGKLLAYASTNYTVKIWDVASSRVLFTLSGHGGNIYCVAFSPDGSRLATSSWDGTARIWDSATGKETVFSLKGHQGGINNIAFSPDGRTLITSGDDSAIRFWSVAAGTEMLTLSNRVGNDENLISDDGNMLAWQMKEQPGVFYLTRLPTLRELDTKE